MKFSTPIRIAFLLGSGISFPAKMPTTSEITEQILSGIGVMRDTKENYLFGQPLYAHAGFKDEYVPRVLKFLERLKLEINQYYRHENGRCTNYEDLYYVASQIYDSETGDFDNPVVQSFIEKILPDIQPLFAGNKKVWKLHEIAREATHYIRDVVWHLLSKKPSRLDHLCCIKDACQDNQLSDVDIFTLNHDTVLEQCLSVNGVQVVDGFGEADREVRYWNPSLFESGSSKVRLFKLHGSVNWFQFEPREGEGDYKIGIPLGRDIWHTRNPQGQMQFPVDCRPMLLAGTFNKMLQYTSGIYAALHYQFYSSLRYTKRVVVCGYGFGDKGINTRVLEWVYTSDDHRILVVHPKSERLKKVARGAILRMWSVLEDKNRLIVIPKPIEDTCWDDINSNLYKTGIQEGL